MTIVVAVLNQKGGAGKTTISINLAHALVRDKKRVLFVDADPQGSARNWREFNEDELFPVVGLDRETLHKDLPAISHGYDYAVIDGAPQIAKLSSAAIKAAHVVLIPVQPSPYDVWACADLVELIQARQQVTSGYPLAAFLISRAIKGTRLVGEVERALAEYDLPIFEAMTYSRVAYSTTALEGKTVFSDANSAAADEISAIKTELLHLIEDNLNREAA